MHINRSGKGVGKMGYMKVSEEASGCEIGLILGGVSNKMLHRYDHMTVGMKPGPLHGLFHSTPGQET